MFVTCDYMMRYVTGFAPENGAVLVDKNGVTLFTDSRYIEAAEKMFAGTEVTPVLWGQRKVSDILKDYKIVAVSFDETKHSSFLALEKIGVKRSRAAVEEGEWILAVFDASRPLSKEDVDLAHALRGAKGLKVAVMNKTDLGRVATLPPEVADVFAATVEVSAAENDLSALRDFAEGAFTDGTLSVGEDAIVPHPRQYAALCRGRDALLGCLSALRAGQEWDAALSDLELAMEAFGECNGRTVKEDVVDRIFSSFCVGK